MAQKYHGKNAEISMGAGSPLTLVCAFADWTATFPRDFTDVSTFCDEDAVELPGPKRPAGSFTGFLTKEDAQLIDDASELDVPTMLRITPTNLEPGVYFEGLAWLTPDYGGSYGGAVTMTVAWRGAGPWSKVWGFTSP
jgi:hypothetical protein